MRPLTPISAAVLLAAALACRTEREPGADRADRPDTSASIALQAAGTIDVRREPQEHLERARAALLARNYLTSAAELRAAADFLRRERVAAGEEGAGLEEPASSLDWLERRVAFRVVRSTQELDSVFTVVHLAEAEYHARRAAESWTRRRAQETAEDLLYAADHLERAAQDAVRDLGGLETAAVDGAREVATDLLKGVGQAPGAVDRAIGMLREGVDEYRSQLASRLRTNGR